LHFQHPFKRLPVDEKMRLLDAIRTRLARLPALWIFAYGSLMWRPCYPVEESRAGHLDGFARRLCVWTLEARGTTNEPGLGLGLEADATTGCEAIVQRVRNEDQSTALAALWDREMLTGIYQPCLLPVATPAGTVTALGFIADPNHAQYAGQRPLEWQAKRVSIAVGELGSCLEYVQQTVRALDERGIYDDQLHSVLDRATRLAMTNAEQ